MKIYNTLTRQKEELTVCEDNAIKIYVCGPTVYNYFHIGNARPFIIFDVLRRYLLYKGFNVKYIQNFTDVDDKIIDAALKQGVEPSVVSERFIEEYFKDARALGIMDADVHPKVSEHIPEIIEVVSRLIDKGYAYEVNGDVYYRVASFEEYGKLSGQSANDLISGARIEINEEKENPLDFVLWKSKKEGEPFWISPWGEGRPGWHIECSAMSHKYLGDVIDIHGGGQDLIFPHHENEIAQSIAAFGTDFVRFWMHNGYVNINNEKMAKSTGNFLMVRDISKSYDLEVVRMFILSAHYKGPINFSDEILKQSQAGLERLYNVKNNLNFLISEAEDFEINDEGIKLYNDLEVLLIRFEEEMDDDLNTANAITILFEMAKKINSHIDGKTSKKLLVKINELYLKTASVLGLLYKNQGILDEEIEALIDQRQMARKAKDFVRSDEIREILRLKGIALEDTREGVKWRRI